MPRRVLALIALLVVGAGVWFALSPRAQFLAGGALINLGYRFQDHLHSFDFVHHEDITPEDVWQELHAQNELASSMRTRFARSTEHPLVAMLVCMDARIDTNELAGDTRRNYYIVRTAGSVMNAQEEDMLELAVQNGVKLIVLTTHTDCAAEKAAASPELRARFPALTTAVAERETRVQEFLKRPFIATRIAEGKLLVKELLIETENEHFAELDHGKLDPQSAPERELVH